MKFLQVMRDEGKYLLSGRVPLLLIIFFLPLFFTVLFGVIYQQNVVKHIPTIIYDQDQSSLSRTLVQMYADSERYDIQGYVDTQEEMEQAIADSRAMAAVAIPRDFSKRVKTGAGAEVGLIVNSTNNMFGNAALSSAQEIQRSFSVAVAQKQMEGLGKLPKDAMNMAYPVHLGVRILNNPATGYAPFMLAGLMLNGFQIGLMLAAAPVLVTECLRRRYGKEYPSWLILLAKFVPYWLAAVAAYFLSLLAVVYGFQVPMRGSWLDALVLGGCFAFFVLGVMQIFSACSPGRVMSLQAPMVYIMPGLLYSGLSWPAFDMNELAGDLSLILPISYAGDNLRDILLAGYAPALWHDCGRMLLGGCIGILIGLAVFSLRRHGQKKGDDMHEHPADPAA